MTLFNIDSSTCNAVNLAGSDATADQELCEVATAGRCTYTPDDPDTTTANEEACEVRTVVQHVVNCAGADLTGSHPATPWACEAVALEPGANNEVANAAACLAAGGGGDACTYTAPDLFAIPPVFESCVTTDAARCENAGRCTYTPDDPATTLANEEACSATTLFNMSQPCANLTNGTNGTWIGPELLNPPAKGLCNDQDLAHRWYIFTAIMFMASRLPPLKRVSREHRVRRLIADKRLPEAAGRSRSLRLSTPPHRISCGRSSGS